MDFGMENFYRISYTPELREGGKMTKIMILRKSNSSKNFIFHNIALRKIGKKNSLFNVSLALLTINKQALKMPLYQKIFA